jgi:hypothetical protein
MLSNCDRNLCCLDLWVSLSLVFFSASRGILQVFFPTGYVIIINVVTSAL